MKYSISCFFLCCVFAFYGQPVHIGTPTEPSILKINHLSESAAITWDDNGAQLKGAQDALIWNRAKLRFLLDANNDNGVASQFSLFSDVSQGDNNTAPVNFNLSGGKSWIDSGNFGIGTKNPTMPLEVGGIIYSNTGGIKFPDESIQITAALNSDPATQAKPKLMGFLVINDLPGEIDTTLHFPQGASFNVSGFPIYDSQMCTSFTGPGVPTREYGTLKVSTDIAKQSPTFFQRLLTGQVMDSVSLFFIQEGSSGLLAHYSIQLENSVFTSSKNEIRSAGDGNYAHLQLMSLNYETIKWISHTNPSNSFCWDVVSEAECGGGG